jgi:23S rRNA pseudouridine1911/1915/1917 synthase
VHRLDRPTSGAVVFAKTSKAAARVSESFSSRVVKKHYVCVVNGHVAVREGMLCDRLVKSSDAGVKVKVLRVGDDTTQSSGACVYV